MHGDVWRQGFWDNDEASPNLMRWDSPRPCRPNHGRGLSVKPWQLSGRAVPCLVYLPLKGRLLGATSIRSALYQEPLHVIKHGASPVIAPVKDAWEPWSAGPITCCTAHSAAYRRWRLTFMKVLSQCRRDIKLKWKWGEVMYLQSPT